MNHSRQRAWSTGNNNIRFPTDMNYACRAHRRQSHHWHDWMVCKYSLSFLLALRLSARSRSRIPEMAVAVFLLVPVTEYSVGLIPGHDWVRQRGGRMRCKTRLLIFVMASPIEFDVNTKSKVRLTFSCYFHEVAIAFRRLKVRNKIDHSWSLI